VFGRDPCLAEGIGNRDAVWYVDREGDGASARRVLLPGLHDVGVELGGIAALCELAEVVVAGCYSQAAKVRGLRGPDLWCVKIACLHEIAGIRSNHQLAEKVAEAPAIQSEGCGGQTDARHVGVTFKNRLMSGRSRVMAFVDHDQFSGR